MQSLLTFTMAAIKFGSKMQSLKASRQLRNPVVLSALRSMHSSDVKQQDPVPKPKEDEKVMLIYIGIIKYADALVY